MTFVSVTFATTGYFTVGQEDGRWWLFDTQGNRFFSTGVNVVSPGGYYAPDLGYAPYNVNIMNLYGTEEAWAAVTLARLQSWGFNTLGAWSDVGLFAGQIPYTKVLYLSGSDWQQGNIPDYFSQDFYDHVDSKITSSVAPVANDPYLLGYFFDNELRWGPDWRGLEDMFAIYYAMPADAPGKIELVDFLRDRYSDDISAFNSVWGMVLADFNELLPLTQIEPVSFDPDKAADRDAFLYMVADHFFSVCHDAIRAVDTNHLILGARFVSWVIPKPVAEAIVNYTDVVSINHYKVWPIYHGAFSWLQDLLRWYHTDDMLIEFYQATGKPIMISEFSCRGMDSNLPNTWPPNYFFYTAADQDERTDFFEEYARETFATGYTVGYHWFAYMDEPPEGRFDGENSNFGLVDNEDTPWQTLVDRMTIVNADALTWPIPDDDDDDDDNDDNDDNDNDDNDDNDNDDNDNNDDNDDNDDDKKKSDDDDDDSTKCGG